MTFEDWASARLEPLLRFAAVLCGSRPTAEDVVQDVLVKAIGRWDTIQAADKPDSYLRRMVINEYLSWRRKWSRIVPRADIRITEHDADPAAGLADRDQLVTELAKLPKRWRTVLVLRYYGGHTDAEIAEILGCSAGTIRGYASRALAALRVELAPETSPKEATHAH